MPRKPNAEPFFGIRTVYHRGGLAPLNRYSKNANRAVAQAVSHMQINHYGAHLCEVYDLATGELHATIRRMVSGRLVIDYARNPLAFEARYAVAHLLAL